MENTAAQQTKTGLVNNLTQWLVRLISRIVTGFLMVFESLRLLWRHPVLVAPMLGFWLLYAPTVVLMNVVVLPKVAGSFFASHTLILMAILMLSFGLTFAALVVLEMLQQLKSAKPLNLKRAVRLALVPGTIKALPLMLGFAFLWFILNLIANLLRSVYHVFNSLSLGVIGMVLVASGTPNWFVNAHKALRLWLFLTLPAIAWEGRWSPAAMTRSVRILRHNLGQVAAGFLAIKVIVALLAVPLQLVFQLAVSLSANTGSDSLVWVVVIAYCGVLTTLMLFLEQIYAANVFMWHLKWERMKREATLRGEAEPTYEQIGRPSFLDDVPELLPEPGAIPALASSSRALGTFRS